MQISFTNELGALERAITRLDEAIVRRKGETGNNFEIIVLFNLRQSVRRMSEERARFAAMCASAEKGHFYMPPPMGGESPTP